ncbi:hypothetical protein M0811_04558 [Anaeramoeba ignava]|uniref:Uncharacterized protein n=1 Tax=Anaeramoeba ignava TaxID=1746090 RepID=A0A9Q0LUB2_ANAIG|nr:hypothetical protein M0811_04558 [Anaeramoeba ignava]
MLTSIDQLKLKQKVLSLKKIKPKDTFYQSEKGKETLKEILENKSNGDNLLELLFQTFKIQSIQEFNTILQFMNELSVTDRFFELLLIYGFQFKDLFNLDQISNELTKTKIQERIKEISETLEYSIKKITKTNIAQISLTWNNQFEIEKNLKIEIIPEFQDTLLNLQTEIKANILKVNIWELFPNSKYKISIKISNEAKNFQKTEKIAFKTQPVDLILYTFLDSVIEPRKIAEESFKDSDMELENVPTIEDLVKYYDKYKALTQKFEAISEKSGGSAKLINSIKSQFEDLYLDWRHDLEIKAKKC